MSRAGTRGSGLDIVPLSQRVAAMMAVRAGLATLLGVVLAASGVLARWQIGLVLGGYLALSALLSGSALVLTRRWAVPVFGVSLLVDGVFLQTQHELIGPRFAVDSAIAIYLVAVCLLASFRSGLKIGLWQSLLMVAALRAEQNGLFPAPGWATGLEREAPLATDVAFIWLAVLTSSAAAAINERELRRRRYDAEALHRFATAAQTDSSAAQVAARLCEFVVEELVGTRAMVCRRGEQGWVVLAGSGLPAELPQQPTPSTSALFEQQPGVEGEVLSLRLDPGKDPWLAARLPGARRLITLAMQTGGEGEQWLVFEHGARRGSRVERRVVSTAAQATATATIALSRARLLEQAERAASTDGLTGVANRRIFDLMLADLVAVHVATGAPFALIMADVDKFKSINDRFGHQTGDQVLHAVARALVRGCGPDGTTARYGGEEFAILLPGRTAAEAVDLAERLRAGLSTAGGPVPVSASFGVAGFPADARDGEELVWKADVALMAAKQTGRDRVVAAQSRP